MSNSMGAMLTLLWWQQAQAAPPQRIGEVFGRLQARIIEAVPGLMTGAIVFAIFYLVALIGCRIIAYAAPRVQADTGVVLLLSRVYFYSIIIFGIITALSTAGLDVSALIAGLGLTGFALGFALKDVLSNLVSGIMLLMYRPFRIGDQIKMGEYEGTIRTIRMRDTVVRSYEGRDIIIPNSKLITEVVVNNTSAKLVRESILIGITPEADVEVARELFLQEMDKHSAITGRAETPVRVRHQEGTILLEGRFWFNPRRTNREVVKSEVAHAVKTALERANIKMISPTEQQIQAHLSGEEALRSEEVEAV